MRLIDADTLKRVLDEQIDDFANNEDKECFRYAKELLIKSPTAKAIPIEWLHRKLIDMMYDGKAKEETIHVFHGIIGDWEKQNERL